MGEALTSRADLESLCGIVLSGESEVDNLDLVTVLGNTENVLRFQVQMQHLLTVHVAHSVTDLNK